MGELAQYGTHIEHVVDQKLHIIRVCRIHRLILYRLRRQRGMIVIVANLGPYRKNMAEEL